MHVFTKEAQYIYNYIAYIINCLYYYADCNFWISVKLAPDYARFVVICQKTA